MAEAHVPTIEAFTDDVRKVLDGIGCTEVVILVRTGASQEAMVFGALYPGRTIGLLLADAMS